MPDSPSLYAFLIGINDYDSESLRRLDFAVADVLEFGGFLHERARLPDERCVKLTSSVGRADSRPTRSRLLAAFDRFAQTNMSAADTFILYFAGHAFAVEGETFLMACDSEPGSKDLLTASAVSLRALEPFLRRIRAGQQLLILDACRNEPRGQARGSADAKWDAAMTRDIQALAAPVSSPQASPGSSRHGRAILSACWEGSVAFEFPAKRHSWFCHHVLETLRQIPQGSVEFSPQWVEQLGRRMRKSAPLLLPEATAQQPHLILAGSPIRLEFAPRPGPVIPTGPDPAQVVVQEAGIAPLQVEVATFATEQVAAPGLPPIPGDILELEGRVQGLEQALQQLQAGTHPSLRPAQAAVRQMEEQWQALVQDLDATAPALPKKIQQRLLEEAVKAPPVPLSQLCALVPDLPTATLLPYVQRLRNVDRARVVLENTRIDYEAAQQRELARLQADSAAAQETLKARKTEDLTAVLNVFFDQLGETPDFPLEAWNAFEPGVLNRRYPWSDREILERAEQLLQERREGQEKLLREQRDHEAWGAACASPTRESMTEYLRQCPQGAPQGAHMDEALDWIEKFDLAEEAREELLRRRAKRRRVLTTASLLAFAVLFCAVVGKRLFDARQARAELARQEQARLLEAQRQQHARVAKVDWNNFEPVEPQEEQRQQKARLAEEQKKKARAKEELRKKADLPDFSSFSEPVDLREMEKLRKKGDLPSAGLKPGDTCMIELGNAVRLELCAIPAGEFLMGSTKAEREWAVGPEGQGKAEGFAGEGDPPRLTRINNAFWMGRTEVTVGQWKRFVADTRYQTDAEKAGQAWCFDWDKKEWGWVEGKSWRDPNYGFVVRNEHPVACTSWNDAVAFCRWLTEKERAAGRLPAELQVRLPGEAEWEYACRGGQAGGKFWWGDSVAEGRGRLNAASDDKLGYKLPENTWQTKFPWSDGYAWVSPVDDFGAKGRNGFGLADMLGNVWEWCLDAYDEKGAHEDVWTGDTARRVLRGGSFSDAPGSVRCAGRVGLNPPYAGASGGFRVVLGVAR